MKRRVFRIDERGSPSALGPLESRVMESVWSTDARVTVSEVLEKVNARSRRSLAYSTVKTVLTNLATKGHLRKQSNGRANAFEATKSREEFDRGIVSDVVGPLFKTHRNPLLAHIVDEVATNDAALEELERLLSERRVRGHRHP